MSETEEQSILGRKTAAGREQRKARAMTLQKAMRVTMAKVADQVMDLPVSVIGVVVQSVAGDDVEAALDDAALLLLLDGPARCTGGVVIDPGVVGAFIQQQTIGSVQPDMGDTRPMTRTDAAICAPLIDALIARAARIADEEDDRALIEGFTFGAKAEDARTLALVLDAADYVSIRLTLDIDRGNRQGTITLLLPTLLARQDTVDGEGDETEEPEGDPGGELAGAVMGLNADLDMIVCTLQLPLNTLQAWEIGQTLPLTPGTFPSVQITTRLGRVLARGMVGQVDGIRAVMPTRPPTHASQPLRRESDRPNIDLPQVEVLSSTGRRSTVPRELDVNDAEIEEAMRALSLKLDGPDGVSEPVALPPPSDIPDVVVDLPAMVDKSAADGLPDLEDLPNLEDLPDLAASSDKDGLPELDDFPDLEDLPDLADLPDLQMQSAG
ncbi:hypothetical protein [Tateyamaria sp.]|uniref:hypothetical protein n=1 Tax=Tateyamaria sp. TaxID=1929288 RepID=UPI0032A0319D